MWSAFRTDSLPNLYCLIYIKSINVVIVFKDSIYIMSSSSNKLSIQHPFLVMYLSEIVFLGSVSTNYLIKTLNTYL